MDKLDNLIGIEQQKRNGLTLVGQQRYNRGHTLFQINVATGEITVAIYSKNYWTITLDGIKKGVREVEKKPNCIYMQFLNKKNAQKWASKNLKVFKV